MVNALAILAVLALACSDKSTPTAEPSRGDAPAVVDALVEDAIAKLEEEPPDPGKLIADLGAIPAWQAVIDRAQLLARRGQRGTVYGRVGGAVASAGASSYVWLVDDTEGNGTLGIAVALGAGKAKPGDRVALGGAWELDDNRRWYWKVDTVQALPPAPASALKDAPTPEPSHLVRDGNLTAGSRTITVARDNDAVYFQLVGPPPANEGDGWLVADELGDTPFALLTMPGERQAYGGQDMRAADERWHLKKAQTYWVRIGRIRKRTDKPALIKALTAPVRVN